MRDDDLWQQILIKILIFKQEKEFENCVCEMAAILFRRPRYSHNRDANARTQQMRICQIFPRNFTHWHSSPISLALPKVAEGVYALRYTTSAPDCREV